MPSMSSTTAKGGRENRTRGSSNRYDALVTSPTFSSLALASSPEPSDAHSDTGGDGASDVFDKNSDDEGPKRSWADDDVPDTVMFPPSSGTVPVNPSSPRVKMPHNASVFVGSLPPHVEEEEIIKTLQRHLSTVAVIQKVHFVHDQKGVTSAFIQCEDSDQARNLIVKAPQPFHGRVLRYESARAHRTLWVSYRTPKRFVSGAKGSDAGQDVQTIEGDSMGRWIDLELPTDLRILLPSDSKHPVVLYNADAKLADPSKLGINLAKFSSSDPLSGRGLLMNDLTFDEEGMRELLSTFGPLEYFRTISIVSNDTVVYPPGHDVQRHPVMDMRVWEVKFGHRDDCNAALSTLKRIYHISVTKANQVLEKPHLKPNGSSRNSPNHSPKRHGQLGSPGRQASQKQSPSLGGSPRSLLEHKSPKSQPPPTKNSVPASPVSFGRATLHLPVNALPSPIRSAQLEAGTLECATVSVLSARKDSITTQSDDGWAIVGQQVPGDLTAVDSAQTLASNSIVNLKELGESGQNIVNSSEIKLIPNWTDLDFPSLPVGRSTFRLERAFSDRPRVVNAEPGDVPAEIDITSNPDEDNDELHIVVNEIPAEIYHARGRPSLFHRRSLSNPIPRIDTQNIAPAIPPTPELGNTPYSIESPVSAAPRTPMYPSHPLSIQTDGALGKDAPFRRESVDSNGFLHGSMERREIDPKSIFVGGLEPFGSDHWSEGRLRLIFGKYGEIENVKFVHPPMKRSGFAFVTFSSEDAPSKAIAAEHNRMYGSRAIRVQIRDIYPMRSAFKPRGRGNGRFRYNGLPSHFDARRFESRPEDGIDVGQHRGSITSNIPRGFHQPFDAHSAPAPLRIDVHGRSNSSAFNSSRSYVSNVESVRSAESDTNTAVSISPPPASNALPTTAPITPHAQGMVQPVYFPSPTWTSPYPSAMYPVAVGPYGAMFPPVALSYVPSTDANGNHINVPLQWPRQPGMSYVPYMVPPAGMSAGPKATPSTPHTPIKGQPPVNATGFVQGEHGTLIPIYQSHALNHYMNGSQNTNGVPLAPESSPGISPISGTPNHALPSVYSQIAGGVPTPGQVWPGCAPQFNIGPQAQMYAYPMLAGPDEVSSPTSAGGAQHRHLAHQQGHPSAPWVVPAPNPGFVGHGMHQLGMPTSDGQVNQLSYSNIPSATNMHSSAGRSATHHPGLVRGIRPPVGYGNPVMMEHSNQPRRGSYPFYQTSMQPQAGGASLRSPARLETKPSAADFSLSGCPSQPPLTMIRQGNTSSSSTNMVPIP